MEKTDASDLSPVLQLPIAKIYLPETKSAKPMKIGMESSRPRNKMQPQCHEANKRKDKAINVCNIRASTRSFTAFACCNDKTFSLFVRIEQYRHLIIIISL